MNKTKKAIIFLVILSFFASPVILMADNIDSTYKYSWGENIGWMNWKPSYAGTDYGVTVYNECLTGYIWAENAGWISLNCSNTDSCATVDYKVSNDGAGNLSGYAWGENVGWINMNCSNTNYCGTVNFKVKTTWTANTAPTVTAVSTYRGENEVTVFESGEVITFKSTASDPDGGDTIKLYICDSLDCTNCQPGNTSGCYAVTETGVTTNPSATYTSSMCEYGTHEYWAKVCDNHNACSDIMPL